MYPDREDFKRAGITPENVDPWPPISGRGVRWLLILAVISLSFAWLFSRIPALDDRLAVNRVIAAEQQKWETEERARLDRLRALEARFVAEAKTPEKARAEAERYGKFQRDRERQFEIDRKEFADRARVALSKK